MYVGKSHKDWVIFAYNSSFQKSTNISPYELLYGRKPVLPIDRILAHDMSRYTIDLDDYLFNLKDHLKLLYAIARLNLSKSQDQQAHQYNKRIYHPDFHVGDFVMLYNFHTPRRKHQSLNNTR